MVGDTLFNIAHEAVAEFDCVFVYNFMELVVCWEASPSNVKNFLPMLVAMFLLNGGLNQVIFLLLFLLLFSFVLFVRGSDFFGSLSLGVFPLLFWMVPLLVYFSVSIVFQYIVIGLCCFLKYISPLAELFESHISIPFGKFLMIEGG